MFKTIEYALIAYLVLALLATAGIVYFFVDGQIVYGVAASLILLFALYELRRNYRKYNENIIFLLNALDNGDYSFHFTEAKISKREKELNMMLNRIKEILSRAKTEVIENEKFMSLIIESVSTGIIILDEHNNVKSVNQTACDYLDLPIFTHINQLRVIDEGFPELFKNLRPGSHTQIKISDEREEKQLSIRTSSITLKDHEWRIIALSSIDSELEAKEMESWVKLIRVMTHEIMNSIAPITSLSDSLLMSFHMQKAAGNDISDNTIEAIETISNTAKGLINFVQSYRKFTGIPKPEPKPFDVVELINQVVQLEANDLQAKDIRIEMEGASAPVTLTADKGQITQVLVNLIKNAIEAIDPATDGLIRISLDQQHGPLKIEVANNGKPIPQEVIPQIFVPFFTTKEIGSGIGLSVSRYILRLHGGYLKHHYTKGFTTFSMSFGG